MFGRFCIGRLTVSWQMPQWRGLLPRLRYLFVTDELLRRLTPTDLQVITAHEAAHCRFGHLPRLATSLAIPFFALLLGDPLAIGDGLVGPGEYTTPGGDRCWGCGRCGTDVGHSCSSTRPTWRPAGCSRAVSRG